jgi:hypothetical protein
MGGRNVIDAAINQGVARTLALSTDKAVSPINLGRVSNGTRHGANVSNRGSNEVIKQGDRGAHSTILSLFSMRWMATLKSRPREVCPRPTIMRSVRAVQK